MLNLSHKRLEARGLSLEIINIIYKLTEDFPTKETYGISS